MEIYKTIFDAFANINLQESLRIEIRYKLTTGE